MGCRSLRPVDADILGLIDERIAAGKVEVPLWPRTATRVVTLTRNPDVDLQAVAGVIRTDPSLAAHVLRIANSAMFGSSSRIVSLPQALARLGLNQVQNALILIVCQTQVFSSQAHAVEARTLLRTSVATAAFAQEIARMRRNNVEEAFLCGLLQDVGIPILWHMLEGLERETRRVFSPEQVARVVDVRHAEIGAYVAEKWKLPLRVADAIRAHHTLSAPLADATSGLVSLAAAQLGRVLADDEQFGRVPDALYELVPTSRALNLYPDDIAQLIARRDDILASAGALS